jgi:iron-sulfur cluster assembly accessory protein
MRKNILESPFKVVDALALNIILVSTQKSNGDDIIFGKTIIDKSSLEIISGSVVDFKKEMIGESFVIDNPKATASCGCGLSFSV